MKILNFGSINIDLIFRVDHIVAPKETISSSSLVQSSGGKGANQSVAVAKCSLAEIYHAGLIGPEGLWLKEKLNSYNVDTTYIKQIEEPTGQAIIQLDKKGQNSIVLYGGANQKFTKKWIDEVLEDFPANNWIMIQNETNHLDYIIDKAKEKNHKICFNPAPFDNSFFSLPINKIDLLIVNEIEAEQAIGESGVVVALNQLANKYQGTTIVITCGSDGVLYSANGNTGTFGTWKVPVVDTTAAGDTFIGYFLASYLKYDDIDKAIELASRASNITIMNKGAIDTIPTLNQLDQVDSYPYTPSPFNL
jgi:ribokinase